MPRRVSTGSCALAKFPVSPKRLSRAHPVTRHSASAAPISSTELVSSSTRRRVILHSVRFTHASLRRPASGGKRGVRRPNARATSPGFQGAPAGVQSPKRDPRGASVARSAGGQGLPGGDAYEPDGLRARSGLAPAYALRRPDPSPRTADPNSSDDAPRRVASRRCAAERAPTGERGSTSGGEMRLGRVLAPQQVRRRCGPPPLDRQTDRLRHG